MVRVLTLALGLALAACVTSTPAAEAPDAGANAEHGADLFDQNCSACHSVAPALRNKMGPSLFGVVGRTAGAVEGYEYSQPLRDSGTVWSPEALDGYLANPQTAVPGNKMKFDTSGLKPAERADIVAFLAAQK